MRHLFAFALAFTLIGGSVQAVRADQPVAPFGFGTLESTNAQKAQSQAKAWLKEVGKTDAATLQRFEAIWKQSHRAVIDRVADTLALGNAQAARLLQEAQNPTMPAPTKVPDILTNKKQPEFFRSNLALAYARRLIHRKVYEEALDALKTVRAEQVVDPGSYLFHRAVCEHGLLHQKDANQSINRLLDEVIDSPERYKTVAVLMLLDMQAWKDKDLGSIARKMENIERRLELARGGPKTQKLQREVVFRLDELIKKLEKKGKGGGGGGGNGGACPNGGSPSGGPPQGSNPSSPATRSGLPQAPGRGTVTPAKLRKLAGEWGRLPERERNRILQELTRGMSASHREAVENYFRKLTETRR